MRNKLILGTVQMGIPYGINNPKGKISKDESFKILKMAYENGIRTLDSAEAYGSAHELIGSFHKENARLRFNVITKIPKEITLHHLGSRLLSYVEELNVEMMEAVMFHSFSSYSASPQLKAALTEHKEKGVFKYLGVSLYTSEEFEPVIQDDDIDLIQLPFNMFDNLSVKGELLKTAKRKGKIIHTRSAFLQGLFFKDPEDEHPVVRKLFEPLAKIQHLSKEYGLPVAGLALLYCLKQEYIDRVIIGVDSLQQLQANLKLSEADLSGEVMDQINCIQIENKNLLNPALWP